MSVSQIIVVVITSLIANVGIDIAKSYVCRKTGESKCSKQ